MRPGSAALRRFQGGASTGDGTIPPSREQSSRTALRVEPVLPGENAEPADADDSPSAFERCLEIRTRVFVDEQAVSREEEFDGLDASCRHWIALDGDTPVGTARLRHVDGWAKAERVAVLASHRRAGVGRALMEALEAGARSEGHRRITLNAQLRVIRFYESLGYAAEGPVFEEAEIPHRRMTKQLDR